MADILNTWANLHLSFAYNLGQDSAPATSTAEYAKRSQFLNEARFDILNERGWWFLIKETTDTTVADQTEYTLPTDCGVLEQLRIDTSLPYERIPYEQRDVFGSASWDIRLPAAYGKGVKGRFYVLAGKFGILPYPTSSGDTIDLLYRQSFDALDSTSLTTTYLIPVQFRMAWVYLAIAFMWESKGRFDKGDYFRSKGEIVLDRMRNFHADYEPIGSVYDPDFAP